jgi:hypothetical protein
VYELSLRLREHFINAIKTRGKRRFNPPDEAACFSVAQALATIEISKWKQRRPVERSRILAVESLRRSVELVAIVGREFERIADYGGYAEAHTAMREIADWQHSTENLIPMLFGDPRDEIMAGIEFGVYGPDLFERQLPPVTIAGHRVARTRVVSRAIRLGTGAGRAPRHADRPGRVRPHQSTLERHKSDLVATVDRNYGCYEFVDGVPHFREDRFIAYTRRQRIAWPMLGSGKPDLQSETFRAMASAHPRIAELHELRATLAQLRNNRLAVGRDGRNRTLLGPYGTKTGRNAPSNSKFVFGPAKCLRFLIAPAIE